MRALIVEDEKTPRELLRDLVPWSTLGFDRVDTARNGLDALGVLDKGGVDLVLTDVRMPKMDGIELAVEVRRRWPECVLIFLSGYSDKEYLKTAIRVQAQDYLDKPIDLATVEAAVARASTTVLQRQQTQAATEREERVRRELSPLRRQAQAQSLFRLGPESDAVLEDRFASGPLRALVLEPSAGQSRAWRTAALALLNADEFPFPSFVAAPGPENDLVLACDRTLSADPPSFDRAIEAVLALCDGLDPALGFRLGVSPTSLAPGMHTALNEARQALAEAFYRPSQRIYGYRPPSGRALEWSEESAATLNHLLQSHDGVGVERQLELLEQRALGIRDPDHARVRAVFLQALTLALGYVPAWGPSERTARLDRLERELAAASDLASVAALARECFRRLFLQTPGDLHVGDRIQRARAFIAERYADPDLTVDAIAGHVGFSESYFCTVFKQALGSTVKDYVTHQRIDRAKAYLWEKDPPSLADLAWKVGFRDPNYFSTVFKRVTGTSPGAYRKKALG